MKPGLCPDFPVMVNDWLSSTPITLMTTAEAGGFWFLLCHAWNDPDCTLPDDDAALAQLSRLGPDWSTGSGLKIRQCFEADPDRPGRIFNAVQRRTRTKQISRIESSNEHCARMRSAKAVKRGNSLKEPLQESSQEPLQEPCKA